MKRFIFTIIAAAAFFSAGAQSLKTFYVVLPKNADPEVEQIYVSGFTAAESAEETAVPQFGNNLANGIKKEIRDSERYGDVEFIPPSWRRTDIYEVAEDEADAQWVITGTVDVQTDSKRDVKEVVKSETGDNVHNIPFEAIYYDYMNSTNTKVTMELKDKQGNVIVTYNKEKAASSNPKVDMREPSGRKLKSHAALVNSNRLFFVTDMANQFLPFMKSFHYEFAKIKNRDMRKSDVSRDRFKELRKMMRDEKDLVKSLDYYGLGELYRTVAEETGLEEAKLNMAYVYEVLGNFTRAREIHEELGRTKDVERVDVFIAKRDQLAAFGKDFFEPEI